MITPPQPWPDPPPRRPESSFRHYLLVDDSVQWFAKLARVDPEQRESGVKTHDLIDAGIEAIDLPSGLGGDFLANIYQREQVKGPLHFAGQSWGAWSLSPAEYARIKRLIELQPAVNEAAKLAAYSV